MPTFTPQPKTGPLPPPPSTEGGAGSNTLGKGGTEIVVMPEKYYGVAAKMEGKTQAELEMMVAKKAAPPPPSPKPPVPAGPVPRRSLWPFIVLFFLVVVIIGSGFIWFNREALFQPPVPPIVVEPTPTPPLAPNAPANLVAVVTTGTSPAVALSWIDGGGDANGFRLERREGSGTFLPLTPLPGSSISFLDVTVRTGQTYQYRVLALGTGGESSTSNITTARVEEGTPIAVVPTLPPGGLDSDSDGLSDVEETIFGTDPHVPDTDGDGFLDGNEAFHLYNPAAVAPVRLLDSGLIVPFVSPAGWSFYIPKAWTPTLDETDGSTATIRTGQGETFHISIEDNSDDLSLAEWYTAQHPNSISSQLREIRTKGGLDGLVGSERLDTQFAWDGKIIIFRYDNAEKPFIQFRTTYEMMLNSLRLSGVPTLPETQAPTLEGPGDLIETTSTTP